MRTPIFIFLPILLLYACSSSPGSREQINYPKHPRSILVMPPVNRSVDIDAPLTFLATSAYPLSESGYYVLPVALTNETFRENGMAIAEEAHAIPHGRLHEIFGADAALYITINQYGAIYYVVTSAVVASASARLVDLRSGEELWAGRVQVADSSSPSTAGLIGTLVEAVVNQVVNTLANRAFDVGRSANRQLLFAGGKDSILYGPYHPLFGSN